MDRHWRGLRTPFESISAGIKLRSFIETKLSSFPLGGKITAKVLSLKPDQFELLGTHAALAQRFLPISPTLKCRLDGQSVGQSLAMLNTEVEDLQEFLALDPDMELSRIELPIEQIAKIAELRKSRNLLAKHIDAMPLRHAIEAIGRTKDRINCATAAVAWI